MSHLDPVYIRQFGWAQELEPSTLMSDPALIERLMSSYIVDPDYTFPDVASQDELIDGPLGAASLPIRVYGESDPSSRRPVLVWAHGGGFMAGALDDNEADGVSREVASRSGSVVISVGYHLADGEVAYPTLHREFSAALDWVLVHADELGVDRDQVTAGGASAGANLALAAVLERRDNGQPLPRGLALIYPALQDAVAPGTDDADLGEVPPVLRISPEMLGYMFQMYRGGAEDAQYSVLEGHELAGLPASLVVAAEFDDLRPSAREYAVAATHAGVAVHEVLEEGAAHGFLAMTPTVGAADRTLQLLADFTRSGSLQD